ncbi:unnamed protein product [Rhizophagus irregularis]|nr:unnamed protein product [Rhizophagus irregularis]
MISEHIENKELTQVIPIRTINNTIKWTEEIRQPWELNREFTWPEEFTENPFWKETKFKKNQLEETQYQLNETARMCNENANMVMNAQEWMKYFKNNMIEEINRVEEIEQEINFVTNYLIKW